MIDTEVFANQVTGVLGFALWTWMLARRIRTERNSKRTIFRLVAIEYVVWLVSLTYMLQALVWPEVEQARFVAAIARAVLVLSGLVFVRMKPREMR